MTPPDLISVVSAAERGGVLLAYASLEGALVVTLVWLVCFFLARNAPSLRCALWWTACLKLLLGLSGIVLVSLPLLPAAAPLESPVVVRYPPNASVLPSATTSEPFPFSWTSFFIGLWIIGVLAGLALTARQMWKAHRVIRRASPMRDRRTSALFADLSRRVGLERAPDLRVSDEVSIPQVVGVLSPSVILPRAHLESFSESDLTMALCHELVHVRRNDLRLGWVPALARRIFFFHPAAAWADHEYRVAREAACDAEVLRVLEGCASSYGRLLLKLSALPGGALTPSAAAASPFLDLRRRLHMLEHTHSSGRIGMMRWAAVAVLSLTILVPVRVVARTSHSAVDARSDGRHPGFGNPTSNAYVFFLDDRRVWMNGSVDDDLPRARTARGDIKGKLLWFRLGDDAYLIRDARVLGMVRDLQAQSSKAEFGQSDLALERKALAAKEQMVAHEKAKLSARMDELRQRRDEIQEQRDASGEGAMGEHDNRVRAAVLEQLAREIRQLEGRRMELERAFEELSKHHEALAGGQERTGEAAERHSQIIDERIYRLLEESISAGIAEHLP